MKPKKTTVHDLLDRCSYRLTDYIKFNIEKYGKKWYLYGDHFDTKIKLFNGTTAGGQFDTLEEAEEELLRILKFFAAPLEEKDILRYFDDEWINGEEQKDQLFKFRNALVKKDWKTAAKIWNKGFSNFTKEAIPGVVIYQVSINL